MEWSISSTERKKCKPRLLYPEKALLITEREKKRKKKMLHGKI
jgi:hypothetical protein